MTSSESKHNTLLAHAGGSADPQTGAVAPPINPTTTFARNPDNSLIRDSHSYARDDNDLYLRIESLMSSLENGKDARVFSSGMAAISSVVRSTRSGSSIVVQSGIYWGTTQWIRQHCKQSGLNLIEIDATNTGLLQQEIRSNSPDMVFLEIPSNPWLGIADIDAAASACEETGACLVVDATVATPLVLRPLDHGAEIVVHSATKILNGHSDVLAGIATTRNPETERWQQICDERKLSGAILGPFEAWLLIRGMRTLPLRLERMNSNALNVARFLNEHEKVERVFYPGLPEHPGHELAYRHMKNGGFGFLLSFTIAGGESEALDVLGRLNLIVRATSLGGVESLIEHRLSIEGPESSIPGNLLRLSLGIESCQDIIDDLDQALSA